MIGYPPRLDHKMPKLSQFQAIPRVEPSSALAAQAATTAFANFQKTELLSSLANARFKANTSAVTILAELNRNSVMAAVRALPVFIINQHLTAISRHTQLAIISRESAITASRALAEATESQRLAAIAHDTQLGEIARVSRSARTAFSANLNFRHDIVPVHPFAGSRELSKPANLADSFAHMRNADPESISSNDTYVDNFVFRTEFSLSVELAPVPHTIGSTDTCAAFDPKHWLLITQLEQRLRQLVEQKLEEMAGPKWIKRRVSESVRERWFRRQSDDTDSGRSVYPAIQYADFMDLADVIVQKDNWQEAFHQIFPDKAEIEVSLHRLHPIRKAIAHSRPLGRADVLTLISESNRIFGWLRIGALH